MGIEYTINPLIVRGLDYYTKTVFEIISTDIGAQGTVCGGGRYDRLVEELGGKPSMPGIGFGMGMERLAAGARSAQYRDAAAYVCATCLCVHASAKQAAAKGFCVSPHALRENRCAKPRCDHIDRSLKAQMKYAAKLNRVQNKL